MEPLDISNIRDEQEKNMRNENDFIEDIFAFDKVATIENLDGLVHLCDAILDEAELG